MESKAETRKLLAKISHDLKNPLSVVLAYCHLLENSIPEGPQSEKAHKHLAALQRAAEKLNVKLEELSDARVEPAKIKAVQESAASASRTRS